MSNERIDEILKEKTGVAPDSNAAIPILQAMEQYGKEQRIIGHEYGVERANIADKREITRLRKLVKAQKELIAIYEKAITLGEPDVWELYLKIKQLAK